MLDNPLITLTTDFGYEDPFVGIMKGVILTINPEARIIDLTHGISPHDIREAGLSIALSYDFFPKDSIHVVVTDPGVGSARRPLIVMADYHYFVGPDNGVFSNIFARKHENLKVVEITAKHYFLSEDSPTFQGRDIFAPAAAWLSRRISMANFGSFITDYHSIPVPVPSMINENALRGEVVHIDRFGNAMTNISKAEIHKLLMLQPGTPPAVICKGREAPLKNYYSEAADAALYSVVNSSGYLELFRYRGSAAREYSISAGESVDIILPRKGS